MKSIFALRIASVSALFAMASGGAFGQGFADPTQPPVIPRATMVNGAPAQAQETGPILQSVLISTSRNEAIISGKVVHAGDRFGNGHVVAISESEVVLRNEDGLQTLKLFPGIEKRHADGEAVKVTETVKRRTRKEK